jgi:catechol 2,3-dioxygenase-like lactoylglutathione lyase family enzyme
MAPEIGLDHCVVHVSDWEKSNLFYTDVLGAELVQNGERWSYRFGTQQLNLHGPGVDATPVAKVPVPPGGSDHCFVWPGRSRAQCNISGSTASRSNWDRSSAAAPGA